MGLWYPKDSEFELIAYSDADHAGCKDDCKSTGGLQFLGEKLASWSSKKQDCTTMSTAKAETEYQLADLFTKALPKEHFEYLVHRIVIIIEQPQRQDDVHQDELCPPNKRDALVDANKKIDLDNPLYSNESKIMENIIQNHPLRYNIAPSSYVLWIYMGQLWHTLQDDESKYRLKFVLDRKEITMTLNDFRIIFHLPQATDNNDERFIDAPKFSEMVQFFLNTLGFTLELRSPSNFKMTGLVQPWQTLGKIFARCLTTRVTGHYMTTLPEISRSACDKYHNLEDDAMVKNIFNSRKHKDGMFLRLSHSRLSLPRERIGKLAPLDTIQLSLAEQKSYDELEAKQNVQQVEEHLIAKEIEKLIKGAKNVENVEVDSSTLRKNDNPIVPSTRLEPRSDKESPKVEITAA
ncbi:hypothetical protein Tco_1310681 [Tanacetum coccineum]